MEDLSRASCTALKLTQISSCMHTALLVLIQNSC